KARPDLPRPKSTHAPPALQATAGPPPQPQLCRRRAMRFFNTEGPVVPEDHYSVPPLQRWDLEQVLTLIAQKKYFLLHAPRQTGKTTCLLALADYLNREGCYRAVYANIEPAQAH
ncbi:hypothetical protein RZS08_33770, partial [Arthrospira platensis SPKY1]|nr:hypothetical protein [Arthrospira platensis SPKY1]